MDGAQDARCRDAITAAGLVLAGRVVVTPRVGAAPRYIVYRVAHSVTVPAGDAALTIRDADGEWTAGYRAVRAVLDLPGS